METATAGVSARVLFVIGASGAGKTAAVRALERRGLPTVRCYYFDTIGVPSPEEMERQWAGGTGGRRTRPDAGSNGSVARRAQPR